MPQVKFKKEPTSENIIPLKTLRSTFALRFEVIAVLVSALIEAE